MTIPLLLFLSVWYARAYTDEYVDPDWSLFNMPAFTGSWYGRDFPDCKTPVIYIWYWLIAKVVGANIARVRFTHHVLMGLSGVLVMVLSGSFWAGLAFTVLINSGWLLAFHGNVGQLPAILIACAILVEQPALAVLLIGAALMAEPKLILSAAAMVVLGGVDYITWAVVFGGIGIMVLIASRRTLLFAWLKESSWDIPKRMAKARPGAYEWAPWFTSSGLLHFLPWCIMAVSSRPDLKYWVPAALYAILVGYGGVIRQNHLIPLIPWVALSGIDPWVIMVLVVVDLLSGGLYLGDIWKRFYIGLRGDNEYALRVGEWLKDRPGVVWVNGYHTGVYIHARRPVAYGLTEQYEISQVATERRDAMLEKWKDNPAKWVVEMPSNKVDFKPHGYKRVASSGDMVVWERVK